jgi:uncharacterized protein (DUF924 family)
VTDFDDESVINDLLRFWFGESEVPDAETQRRWFARDPHFDDLVRRSWGQVIEAAARRELFNWSATPNGALAHVVALDQFPRNVFRDTPRAFAFDNLALEVARAAIDAGHDTAVSPWRRAFFYLPFMHAEDLAVQDESVALHKRLVETGVGDARESHLRNLHYATRHRDIIARFGRYPHRNAILGRETSAEEAEFLSKPGSSF